MARGRRENLIPFNERTEEEQRAIRAKGTKASGETYARRRVFKDLFRALMPMPNEDNPELSNQRAMALAMIREACQGNTQAFKEIRDTMGEKPKEEVESKEQVQVVYSWQE